jgi:ferredoxin
MKVLVALGWAGKSVAAPSPQARPKDPYPPRGYVIAEPCIGTKDTACVDVCPVDCIHPARDEKDFKSAKMLYVHPNECIDCGACEPVCPVSAIFPADELPAKWKSYIKDAYLHYGIKPQ